MLWSDKILDLFQHLKITATLPKGVEILNPYQDKKVFQLCEQFYTRFYSDAQPRKLILGINPGRFGGGLTGIPFTDPIKLEQRCKIVNSLKKKSELSSDFIYQVIDSLGGLEEFYSRFYFSSVSPLGFTMAGKNLNYYDLPKLQSALAPFIRSCIQKQSEFGLDNKVVFVLGEGKNFKFVKSLNNELKLFKKVIPLPHPRFIMQYKRKQLPSYIKLYQDKLSI